MSASDKKHRNSFFVLLVSVCVMFKTTGFQTGLMITYISISGHLSVYKLIHIDIFPVSEM